MFSKLFDRRQTSTNTHTTSINIESPLQTDGKRRPEVTVGRRFRLLRRIFQRHTEEEQILILERKFLKKYLQYYKFYTDGMTLGEMRLAKRFLDVSITSKQWLEEEPPDSSCACCNCFYFKRNSKVTPKNGKRVTFKQHLVQSRHVSVSSESSDEEESTNVKKADAAEEYSSMQFLPISSAVNTNHSSNVSIDSEFQEVPLARAEFDSLSKSGDEALFCTRGDTQNFTYIHFDQPENP